MNVASREVLCMHACMNLNHVSWPSSVVTIIIMHRRHYFLPFSWQVSRVASDLLSKRTRRCHLSKRICSFRQKCKRKNLQRYLEPKAPKMLDVFYTCPHFPVDRGGLSIKWQRLEAKLGMTCKSKLLSEADTPTLNLCHLLP